MSYTNTYSEIYHHGIKGQKWGVRNYQNPDGSLTPLGRQHYGYSAEHYKRKIEKTKKSIDKLEKAVEYGRGKTNYEWEHANFQANVNSIMGATLGSVAGAIASNGELAAMAMFGAGGAAAGLTLTLVPAAVGLIGQRMFTNYLAGRKVKAEKRIDKYENKIKELEEN